MPRIGVDYETIKQAAIKLLSQGTAPSVQKIRAVLGTGSNTTIAEHLKVWREEYANKAIHHLPATMPKELISAVEVLWQAAMDQATQQLASIKHDLMESQEKLRLDRAAMDKTEGELHTQAIESKKTIDERNNQIQTLQTELAVVHEKSKQQINEIRSMKQHYESRLQRIYDEKNSEMESNEILKAEIAQLKQRFNEQIEKCQTRLSEERVLQETSEKRWIQLIDQARTETTNQRKRFENTINKQNIQTENLQTILSELQRKQATQQSMLDQKNERVDELSSQYSQIQKKYQKSETTVAVLQERLNTLNRKPTKPIAKKQLKMAQQS